ncbi:MULTISPECIES: metal ABC transporter permease [Actinoalloteichus]|uniref:ABC-type Mn2+/Zn2+ transport system, permease component n=1 Tax=Actinoalloteichus fjordicus TaxID=1612552 RepID=A0AAC9PS02_9PSEU|nr:MULTISPECIES: metal ABC transporter permease [Actinoalloteichus]APU14316.1 ABC-type Mn2+/Zn2+ transport system, permease component [Actinoalloteichus fjordicus]APU20285.1 ABC-type Mn2+/Zn2+ transport system, permease component [Actinoalloteichus sp. GBA129-24]
MTGGVLGLSYAASVVIGGSALLGMLAGVLGPFAVLRGRSMFGDAMSHGTLPGVVIAFMVGGVKDAPVLLIGAAISALLAALAMIGLERAGRVSPDVAIGVVLSAAFTLGIVLLTRLSAAGSGGQSGLEEYLFGQAAGLVRGDLVVAAIVGALAIGAVLVWFRLLRTAIFDPGFASVAGAPGWAVDVLTTALLVVGIVLGVRTVGAILMVALLVAPAVAARQLTTRLSTLVPLSGLIGAAAGGVGAFVSGRADLPTGPAIVLLATAAALASVLLAPRRGVLLRAVRSRRHRGGVAEERGLSGDGSRHEPDPLTAGAASESPHRVGGPSPGEASSRFGEGRR